MNEVWKMLAILSAGALLTAGAHTIARTLPALRREEEDAPELVMILAGLFMVGAAAAVVMAILGI